MNAATHIVMLDNVDSFTYNLVDELEVLGYQLHVYRNTIDLEVILQHIEQLTGDVLILLSPGPGSPSNAGCMPALLRAIDGKYPVLGICLGHQAIVEHLGGVVDHAGETVHGKVSDVIHNHHPVFEQIPSPFPVARYHSLAATKTTDDLAIIANYAHIPMAVIHEQKRLLGLQFHPESILTPQGSTLIRQCVNYLTRATA